MFAKKLFYVSAALFLFAAAYHLGATSATAQSGARVSGFVVHGYNHYAMTPNGDVFHRASAGFAGPYSSPPTLVGNFWQP